MIKHKNYLHLLGGVDIDPSIYGHKRHPYTQPSNKRRDAEEFQAVEEYVKLGLPVIGVCRGAQLLCVANGGALWQHSEGHHASHSIAVKDGVVPHCEAGHHQIMDLSNIGPDDYKIIAWCPFNTIVYDQDGNGHTLEASPEVVWFPKTKSLAIQPHPEWASYGTPFRTWVDKLVEEYTGQKDIFDFPHFYN